MGFRLNAFGIQTGMVYFSSIYYSLCGHADTGIKADGMSLYSVAGISRSFYRRRNGKVC